MVKKLRLRTRVSQFSFKKSFASKRNLAKQQQFRFVSLQFRETTKKFRFVSLRFTKKAFCFGSFAKKKFRFERSSSGARRGGDKVKKMAWWHWREKKMALVRAISGPNCAGKSVAGATRRRGWSRSRFFVRFLLLLYRNLRLS